MIANRRSFFKNSAMALSAVPFLKIPSFSFYESLINYKPLATSDSIILDEDYWAVIKQAYTVSPQILNFNNGGVSPAPKVVQ